MTGYALLADIIPSPTSEARSLKGQIGCRQYMSIQDSKKMRVNLLFYTDFSTFVRYD